MERGGVWRGVGVFSGGEWGGEEKREIKKKWLMCLRDGRRVWIGFSWRGGVGEIR